MGSKKVFPGSGGGKGVSPGQAENSIIPPPPPQKIPPSVDSPHPPNFYPPPPPTKSQIPH